MKLIIENSCTDVCNFAAKYVRKKINEHNCGPNRYFILGLPTGSTPLAMYKRLISFYKEGSLSFKFVKTFNMDEYVGLPRDHPESYHSFMFSNFFRHIDIDPNNVHILNGNADNADKECENYERKIIEAGGIDLFIGGIGPDGHIAFNEPGSSLASRTRIKTLNNNTIQVIILITGSHKALALHKAIECGVSHMWTVSAFQNHPLVIFIADEDATIELKVKTVKYFKGLMAYHRMLIQ